MRIEKILVISHIILFVLLVYLFVKFYSINTIIQNTSNTLSSPKDLQTFNKAKCRIAFINTDTLLENFNYFQNELKRFEEKKRKIENQLQIQAQALEKEFMAYREKGKQGLLTADEIEQTEYKLSMKNENLMRQRDEMLSKLLDEEKELNNKVFDLIENFLAEYNQKKNQYDLVVGYSKGSGVLYGSPSIDITKEVLTGLNERMQKNK
jgi:outer membrane protein